MEEAIQRIKNEVEFLEAIEYMWKDLPEGWTDYERGLLRGFRESLKILNDLNVPKGNEP